MQFKNAIWWCLSYYIWKLTVSLDRLFVKVRILCTYNLLIIILGKDRTFIFVHFEFCQTRMIGFKYCYVCNFGLSCLRLLSFWPNLIFFCLSKNKLESGFSVFGAGKVSVNTISWDSLIVSSSRSGNIIKFIKNKCRLYSFSPKKKANLHMCNWHVSLIIPEGTHLFLHRCHVFTKFLMEHCPSTAISYDPLKNGIYCCIRAMGLKIIAQINILRFNWKWLYSNNTLICQHSTKQYCIKHFHYKSEKSIVIISIAQKCLAFISYVVLLKEIILKHSDLYIKEQNWMALLLVFTSMYINLQKLAIFNLIF